MKARSSTSSLFQEDEPPEYVVDTSSWIRLNEHSNRDQMWPIVERLIVADRIFSPSIVVGTTAQYGEVISARDLIDPYIEQLSRCDRNDVEFLLKVGEICRKYSRLARPTGSKTRADPWIIALGIKSGYTVVAEESMRHPRAKIIGVCKLENVPCVTIEKLCEDEFKR